MSPPRPLKSTPVLYVETIEASLPFWRDRLGFQVTAEVPEGDRLGFVILQHGAVEVMLQTARLFAEDAPGPAAHFKNDKTFLFIEVEDLEAIAAALEGVEVVMPRRVTGYGATEIGYKEPGGHFVTFAQFAR